MVKKKVMAYSALSVGIMLGLPWLAVTFVRGDAAMAVCFLLFFAVDPICAIAVGWAAGKDLRRLWGMPAVPAILFLMDTWLFFDMGEPAFVRYAGDYLLLGVSAMLISTWMHRRQG